MRDQTGRPESSEQDSFAKKFDKLQLSYLLITCHMTICTGVMWMQIVLICPVSSKTALSKFKFVRLSKLVTVRLPSNSLDGTLPKN